MKVECMGCGGDCSQSYATWRGDPYHIMCIPPSRSHVDPHDPDPFRSGIFATHNCWKCKDGSNPSRCPTPDRPGNCGYPTARND